MKVTKYGKMNHKDLDVWKKSMDSARMTLIISVNIHNHIDRDQ